MKQINYAGSPAGPSRGGSGTQISQSGMASSSMISCDSCSNGSPVSNICGRYR